MSEEPDPVLAMLDVFRNLGRLLKIDDIEDYGFLGATPHDPDHPLGHHWIWGEILENASFLVGLAHTLNKIKEEVRYYTDVEEGE